MSTEFNELLPLSHGDKTQILIIGYRDPVVHTINELCVLRFARDRALFMPLVPFPSSPGKFLTILER